MDMELPLSSTQSDVAEWCPLKQLAKVLAEMTWWHFDGSQARLTGYVYSLTNNANLSKEISITNSLNQINHKRRANFCRSMETEINKSLGPGYRVTES